MSTNDEYMKSVLENALDINICGIVRNTNENAMEIGTIGYTSALTEYIINTTNASEIAKDQLANPTIDIFTGKPFATEDSQQTPQFDMNNLTEEQMQYLASLSDEEKQALIQSMTEGTKNTYEDNIMAIGIMDLADPLEINIYPKYIESN